MSLFLLTATNAATLQLGVWCTAGRVGSISAAAQPAVSRSSGTPDIETTSEAAPVPPFNLQPVKSSWIASVDPFSNEPVYFNPVTGETSKTDPTASRSYNKAGFALPSQAASHDDQKLAAEKVIQQLLPTVNQMSEAYKAHLLALNSDPLSVVRIPESQNAAPSVSKPEIPRLGALPPQLAVLVQQPLASKASATPEVNRVRGVEKASILLTSQGADSDIQGPQSTPSLVDTISARCDVAAVPAETEQAHVNAEKPTAAGIPPRFVPSTTFNGSRPGYVFTTRSGLTGYFWDQEKLNCDTRQNKLQNPAEISPSAQSLNDHALVSLPSSEGLGAWTLVASEDSKFGDCVKEKKPTVSLPPTKIEFVTADPGTFSAAIACCDVTFSCLDIPKSTTDVLSALKEDADASKHLNADDLRRVEKKPFFPLSVASSETTAKVSPVKQEDDVLPTSSVSFKKRVVRPRGLKPMNRS